MWEMILLIHGCKKLALHNYNTLVKIKCIQYGKFFRKKNKILAAK
jgi:hypothetical protein